MDIKILLGQRIREYRLKHKYTQAELAEMLGIDYKHLSRIELGKNMPNPSIMEKFVQIFNIELKDLFEFSYLDSPVAVKENLLKIIDKLNSEQIILTYKYVKTFVL